MSSFNYDLLNSLYHSKISKALGLKAETFKNTRYKFTELYCQAIVVVLIF